MAAARKNVTSIVATVHLDLNTVVDGVVSGIVMVVARHVGVLFALRRVFLLWML